MFSRRSLALLARIVLAWFALHLGAGVAAPVLHASAGELVCSGGLLKVLPAEGDAAKLHAGGVQCPLCAPALAPPPALAGLAVVRLAAAAAVAPPRMGTPRILLAPPTARGPPALRLA
jgi:hypothetical protein